MQLPFQRTRLLRNPWNGNREVKISRDGTEIEPSVGARLLKEFDAEPTTISPDTVPQNSGARRLSYPIAYRYIPTHINYHQQSPQIPAQGVTYVPYGNVPGPQTMIYNYGQPQVMPQPPPPQAPQQQQFGEPEQPYGYMQPK